MKSSSLFLKLRNLFIRLLHGFTNPHPAIVEPGQRSRASLLSGLLFVLTGFAIVLSYGWLDQMRRTDLSSPLPYIPVLMIGISLMVAIYFLSRTRYFALAAMAFMLLATGLILIDIITVRESTLDIAYLIFSVLMSSLFFNRRTTFLILIGLMLCVLSLPMLTPGLTWSNIGNAETFLAVIGVFIIIIVSLRVQDEVRLEAQTRALTERETALNASEEKYRSMVSEINDGIFETDASGRLTFVNLVLVRICGFEDSFELIGRNFLELISPTLNENVAEIFEQFIGGQREIKISNLTIVRPDGVSLIVESKPVLIIENGKAVGTRGVVRDVTARKRAEAELIDAHARLEQRVAERTADLQAANLELEKSSRLKDEFLSGMGHELRTPLTGILGLSEALQMQIYGALNEKQLVAVKHIEASGKELLEIISNILDYSIIGSGKFPLTLKPCSLVDFCCSSLEAMDEDAKQKGLKAKFSINPETIVVQADVHGLKQMLACLLSNAIKFTPQGGSFGIEVSGDQLEQRVHITVWDTGIGIKAEDFPNLFQPFLQLDARLARQYNGIGLGLALASRLAELHGGSISVASIPDSGSRFTISLPWMD
jgi:PAS domain S-box-containing protein